MQRFTKTPTPTRRQRLLARRSHSRSACKYRAQLTLLPAACPGGSQAALRWPLRGVVRAQNHRTGRVQLFTALVTAPDGQVPPGDSRFTVNMAVVGPHPDYCLEMGDGFMLWRGTDIARGVITWRWYI
jgi:hypothetical protein